MISELSFLIVVIHIGHFIYNTLTVVLLCVSYRYLVAKILSSISPSNPQSPSGRRARRDLVAVEGGARPASPVHKRSRRSLDDAAPTSLSQDAPLLRVKRLGDEEGGEGGAGVEGGYRPPPQGLQRMKRVDPEPPSGRDRKSVV